MSNNYTPGPWYATGAHVQSASINEDNYICLAEGNTPEQADINAKLIAAAPEMFETLQLVQTVLAQYREQELPDGFTFEEFKFLVIDPIIEKIVGE